MELLCKIKVSKKGCENATTVIKILAWFANSTALFKWAKWLEIGRTVVKGLLRQLAANNTPVSLVFLPVIGVVKTVT